MINKLISQLYSKIHSMSHAMTLLDMQYYLQHSPLIWHILIYNVFICKWHFAPQPWEILTNVEVFQLNVDCVQHNYHHVHELWSWHLHDCYPHLLHSLGPCLLVILYLLSYTITFWPTSLANESQSNKLQLDTCIGCSNGLCYLAMFQTRYHNHILAELGHFPTIIALATIVKLYRKKVKGKLMLIGDGVAHFEQDKERLVWEVVEGLIGQLEFIGSREMRVFSSTPPEGYHYLELFLPECRNLILQLLGPFPPLQAVVRINLWEWAIALHGRLLVPPGWLQVVLPRSMTNVLEI